jgi:hypothetical protein
MSADAFVQVRVTSEIKARLRALAERDGIAESAVVRQVLVSMLHVQPPTTGVTVTEAEPVPRDARLYVRLRLDDQKLLKARARGRGMPAATYVSLLVRSHLHRVAPVPQAELGAVRESIAELRAIRRTLNTIARTMNSQVGSAHPGQRDLLRYMKVGDVLLDRVKALYLDNIKRWETGDAEASHSA